MVLKQNQSNNFHMIYIILGIIFMIIGSIIYSILYRLNADNLSFENIVYMVICIEIIVFGMALVLISFENYWHGRIMLVIGGFVIVGIIFKEQFRFGIWLFVGTIFVYFITVSFKNIFSTVVTMSACVALFLVLTIIIFKLVNEIDIMLLLYVMFSFCVVIYKLLGKKINQWFISKMLGSEEESKTYDDVQVKNQILLLYMVIFVCLNVWQYQEKIDGEVWNLINNSFLTGLAIIQIDWNKIILRQFQIWCKLKK